MKKFRRFSSSFFDAFLQKSRKNAARVYQAFTEKSDILNGYIVPEYEMLHTQSREYIVDDLLDVMKEKEVEV